MKGLGAAGLVMAIAFAGPAAAPVTAASGPRQLVVTLVAKHSRWSSSLVQGVRVGDEVRFVVRNDDPIDHELIVGPPEVHARHATGTEAHHGTVPGEVSVPAGATTTTTYRFTSPGPVVFGCHLPGHWDYGMTGIIDVR